MDLLWYKSGRGDEPARRFIVGLPDPVGRKAFIRRLLQLESGSLGDHKVLGDGLWEFRIHLGPGYRLYAGQVGPDAFLVLNAGRKGTQSQDLARARRWWNDYRNNI